jgi:MSHA biogenesis protein MshI
MIDFRNEEATIDVLNIPFPKDSPQRARSMYAIVTRTELANEVHRRFQGARLPLKVIDVPEMAQRNVAALVEPEGRAVALVSCDESGSLLTITSDGELFLARRISVSLQQLRVDDASRRMEYQEQVALEIQRSIDHFHRQFAWLSVAKLLVAPMGDSDSGMVAALSDNLDIDVEPLRLQEVLDLSQVPELGMPEMQNKYFMTLGLALRHEESTL